MNSMGLMKNRYFYAGSTFTVARNVTEYKWTSNSTGDLSVNFTC